MTAAADWIHAHPEIGHQEVEASKRLAEMLSAAGARVEMGTAGMATAFKADLGSREAPPRIGTPAEESAAPNSGGKVHMVNAGVFDDVDASIMFHPGTEDAITPDRSLAA